VCVAKQNTLAAHTSSSNATAALTTQLTPEVTRMNEANSPARVWGVPELRQCLRGLGVSHLRHGAQSMDEKQLEKLLKRPPSALPDAIIAEVAGPNKASAAAAFVCACTCVRATV
jgi:hypothetical protein